MAPAKSKASKEVTPFDRAKAFFERPEFRRQIETAVPKHLTPDRMARVALTAYLKTPKLADCTTSPAGMASIASCMLELSQVGLEPDGRLAHLVPFNDKRKGMICQMIIGYQGFIELAYRHPKVKSIWWGVVRSSDQFEHVDGLERKLVHRRTEEEDEGELTHAYAVCELEGGAKTFVVLNRNDVIKAKKSSRGADSDYSPWTTHPEAMWAKTAVRALAKRIPKSNELLRLLEKDDEQSMDDLRFTTAKPIISSIAAHEHSESNNQAGSEGEDGDASGSVEAGASTLATSSSGTSEAGRATAGGTTQPPTEKSLEQLTTALADLCTANGITEDQICGWFYKTYKVGPLAHIGEIQEAAPNRLGRLVADFEMHKAAMKAFRA